MAVAKSRLSSRSSQYPSSRSFDRGNLRRGQPVQVVNQTIDLGFDAVFIQIRFRVAIHVCRHDAVYQVNKRALFDSGYPWYRKAFYGKLLPLRQTHPRG